MNSGCYFFHLKVVWCHVFYDRKRNNQVQLFQSGLEVTCQRIFLTYAYAWWYSNVQNYDKQSSENDRFFKFTLKVTYALKRWCFQFLPWVLAASSFQTGKKESGKASDLLFFLSEPPILSHWICLQLLLFFFFFTQISSLLVLCLCFFKPLISLPKSWNFNWPQQHPCSLRKMDRIV